MPTTQQLAARSPMEHKPELGHRSPTHSPGSSSRESSWNQGSGSSVWQQPTILMVRRGKDLGVTCEDHAGPGVRVSKLNPNDLCHMAGMLIGSAIISVAGTKVKGHAHAIELMEAEAKRVVEGFGPSADAFEVIVSEPTASKRPVVQSL